MNFKIMISILMTALIVVNTEKTPKFPVIKWNHSLQICGSRLTDFVLLICRSKNYEAAIPSPLPTYRQKRQIYDECCKEPCTALYIYENYCFVQNLDTSVDLILQPITESKSNNSITTTVLPPVNVLKNKN